MKHHGVTGQTPTKPSSSSEVDADLDNTFEDSWKEPTIPSVVRSGVGVHIPMFFDFCEEEPVLSESVAGDEDDDTL